REMEQQGALLAVSRSMIVWEDGYVDWILEEPNSIQFGSPLRGSFVTATTGLDGELYAASIKNGHLHAWKFDREAKTFKKQRSHRLASASASLTMITERIYHIRKRGLCLIGSSGQDEPTSLSNDDQSKGVRVYGSGHGFVRRMESGVCF